eukprot:TRINITY_DN22068_c0_g1_i1.p1 TRINITY_DN22068_c0_g1~~TRINITY_DN22068_c0_g1_i1.p1  ORF type:complete len:340 (-),score=76.02 TRINITY_DN22068_c0_g1_i1:647-1540(-)
MGIKKESLLMHLYTHPANMSTQPSKAILQLTEQFITRYLCDMFKDSPRCKSKFLSKDGNSWMIKYIKADQSGNREASMPEFPIDLGTRLLKELQTETESRSAAHDVSELKKGHNVLMSHSGNVGGDILVNKVNKKRKRAAGADQIEERKKPLKKRKSSPPVTTTPLAPTEPSVLPVSAASEFSSSSRMLAASVASASRVLGRQPSAPALSIPRKDPNIADEDAPWRVDINKLWANHLAMMRVTTELAKYEPPITRDLSAMAQEIKQLKMDIYKIRLAHDKNTTADNTNAESQPDNAS